MVVVEGDAVDDGRALGDVVEDDERTSGTPQRLPALPGFADPAPANDEPSI